MILARSAAAASTVVLEPFDAERTARTLREGDITLASLVPTMLARILDAGGRPGPRLRRVLLGGGPCPPALLRRAADAGFPVSQTYGLTEACCTVTLADPGDLETAGRALPGHRPHRGAGRRDPHLRPDRGGGVGRAAHRRPRPPRRPGPPDRDRPQVRHDRHRRRERRARRGRGGAGGAPRRRRGGGVRPPAPGVGRVGDRAVRARDATRRPTPPSCATTARSGSPATRCRRRSSGSSELPRTPSGKLLRRELK